MADPRVGNGGRMRYVDAPNIGRSFFSESPSAKSAKYRAGFFADGVFGPILITGPLSRNHVIKPPYPIVALSKKLVKNKKKVQNNFV